MLRGSKETLFHRGDRVEKATLQQSSVDSVESPPASNGDNSVKDRGEEVGSKGGADLQFGGGAQDFIVHRAWPVGRGRSEVIAFGEEENHDGADFATHPGSHPEGCCLGRGQGTR